MVKFGVLHVNCTKNTSIYNDEGNICVQYILGIPIVNGCNATAFDCNWF